MTLTLVLLTFLTGCNLNYLSYCQHLKSPDGQYNYCLYFDGIGMGDPGFYVLKLKKNIDPEKLKIDWNFKTGTKSEDIDWINKHQILFNYDEAGLLTSNPKIELINERHIVFSRGGYYFGLYDLESQKDTFNIGSPWNEFREKSGYISEKYDKKKEEKAYGHWVKLNISDRIADYISTNK